METYAAGIHKCLCGGPPGCIHLVDRFIVAKVAVDDILKGASASASAASVHTYDYVAAGGVIGHPADVPFIEHLLRAGAAVLEHYHRIFLRGVERCRFEHIAVERHAVALHGEELAVRLCTVACLDGGVVFKHLDVLVGRSAQGVDRRSGNVGEADGVECHVGAECGRCHACCRSQIGDFAFGIYAAYYAVDGAGACRLYVVACTLGVIAVVGGHVVFARSDLAERSACVGIAVEMVVACARRGDDEEVGIPPDVFVGGRREPGAVLFGKDGLGHRGAGIDGVDFHACLGTVEGCHHQPFGREGILYAGYVFYAVVGKCDIFGHTVVDVVGVDADGGVFLSGHRIFVGELSGVERIVLVGVAVAFIQRE